MLVGLRGGNAAAPLGSCSSAAHHPHGEFSSPHITSCNFTPYNQLLVPTVPCPCTVHLGVELGLVFSITFLQVAEDCSSVPTLQALSSGHILHILMPLHLTLANVRRLFDVPLHSIPALQHSNLSSQTGATCQPAECALHPIIQVTGRDVTYECMAE